MSDILRIQIYFWHGTVNPGQCKKLDDMGMYYDNAYYINMSHIEFMKKWNENALLFAPTETRKEWLIGVTSYTNFNQR